MRDIEKVLKHIENTEIFLKAKVDKGENFTSNTSQNELERISNLHQELLYYKQEY